MWYVVGVACSGRPPGVACSGSGHPVWHVVDGPPGVAYSGVSPDVACRGGHLVWHVVGAGT